MGKGLRHLLHKILNRVTLTALLLLVELLWLAGLIAGLSQYSVWITPIFTSISQPNRGMRAMSMVQPIL